MRRVIFLISVALVVSATGCARHHARRYAAAYYDGPSCGCDGVVGAVDGVVMPGSVVAAPQAIAPMPAAVGKSVMSTPIQGPVVP
jgi:hypothetical protein